MSNDTMGIGAKLMSDNKILIIEDNLLNLELTTDLLEANGFIVSSAQAAEEGLRIAEETLPDLVLMDFGLPGMDGLSATKSLKANPATRQLKVVGLTAHAMKGDEEIAMKAGCDGYLTKPIDTRTFAETIMRFMASGSARHKTNNPAQGKIVQSEIGNIRSISIGTTHSPGLAPVVDNQEGKRIRLSRERTGSGGPGGEAVPLNILIVDDVATNRELLRATLEAQGMTVVEAMDGVDALAILEVEKIDAIISDILMPRMDGYRLCHQVRASSQFFAIPFIFYTATYTSPDDEKFSIELGGDIFLRKPVPAAVIMEALSRKKRAFHPQPLSTALLEDLTLTKEYNKRLVDRLEQKNIELLVQTTALETAANAVTITDGKGVILWVNKAFSALNGYTPEEIIGKTPHILKSGLHNGAFYKDLWETILSGKTWQGEFTNRRKDGSLYYGEQTITPVCPEGGTITHFIGIMIDVTARKKADEELNLFRALIDRSSDGIEVLDPETGRYLDINETTCERLGYSRKEMLSMSVMDIEIAADNMSAWPEFVKDIRQTGFTFVEGRQQRKDGSTFPVEVNVRYISLNRDYLVAVVRDVTERKRATEQIEEQAALLDKAQDAIMVCDLEGRIFFWNKGAERMYGWTRAEVWARHVSGLISTDSAKEEEAHTTVLKDGEWSGELQKTAKDGRKLAVEARWTLLRDKEGKPKSILTITTDITEKKKIEGQFLRAQRMESIGTLAGGIAHDLNNILAPIMMAIEMLKETAGDPQSLGILETIECSAQRGADIVRQILSFARGVEGKRVEVQPKHLLKDIENMIKVTFPKNIRWQLFAPYDTWTVLGDPTQLNQILLNLCVNARDAMPDGGVLTIKTENCVLDEQYAAMNGHAKTGPCVIISVTDSGTGMSPDILKKIFDPFFTTKEISKGTGLGLSTVMAIVKSHEGYINVYSEPGKGTTFRLCLPALASSPLQGGVEAEVSLPRGNGETVLVIDDEASILTITSQTLQAFGYRILTANNGAAATVIYAQHHDEIAMVLTDMMMPVMDGRATIHALRQIDPGVKIIGASGLNANADDTTIEAGVKHFLLKPYTAETLLKALRTVMDNA